jgi:hypothetical protein
VALGRQEEERHAQESLKSSSAGSSTGRGVVLAFACSFHSYINSAPRAMYLSLSSFLHLASFYHHASLKRLERP